MKTSYKNLSFYKRQIRDMFDQVAARYDFLNHFLSLGIDKQWRKKLVKSLQRHFVEASADSEPEVLDVATGTADMAINIAQRTNARVTGIDLSENMIQKACQKIQKNNLNAVIKLYHGDAEHLPFNDHSFEAITIAFGIRNFESPERGLKEMIRVTKPGGMIYVLEFSWMRVFPFNVLFQWYFNYIVPLIGKLVSKHQYAYTYLPRSVNDFAKNYEFLRLMNTMDMRYCKKRRLSWGIVSIYEGQKNHKSRRILNE